MIMIVIRVYLAAALLFGVAGLASAVACPNCKYSFSQEDGAVGSEIVAKDLNSVGLGFGWSVLFMLAAPASVAGGLVWLVVSNGRNGSGSGSE